MAVPKVLILMADYGHDPTETAVPYTALSKAGFDIHFATENGNIPRCDKLMLEGLCQKLLGATRDVIDLYATMAASKEIQSPLAWTAPEFTLDPYDLVLLPGGHDKAVRQIIDSPRVHDLMLAYFPQTKKPGRKVVAAICHGVMVLSETKDANGQSVISNCTTTTLPAFFERSIFWTTWPVLGSYYKTYGAWSENTATSVQNVLADPAQFKSSISSEPFVVEDESYNYISARYPPDAKLFGDRIVNLVHDVRSRPS
ncbi:class I glutamine amidotransferase-like protein [Thozetella sp. PMI_491]|nr:class I glutamine amidotransferase-like protein [Thozetella sp. PMI_491]